jgi:CspA family cold shock protein
MELRPNDLASRRAPRWTDEFYQNSNLKRPSRPPRDFLNTRTRKQGYTMQGTVKWFNGQRGFGFIQPENGDKDIFVHISSVERAGMGTLGDGQRVSFDIVADHRTGKTAADNLRAI